jgi:hypothetical protein
LKLGLGFVSITVRRPIFIFSGIGPVYKRLPTIGHGLEF